MSINRALEIIDAECSRHNLPSYTDVAYALQQLKDSLDINAIKPDDARSAYVNAVILLSSFGD